MSISPNIVEKEQDALSSVLSQLQLSATVHDNSDHCGAWAVDTSGSRHIPFHLVGRGEAWLHMDDQPVRALSSGDLVLFPRDDHHIVAGTRDAPPESHVNAEPPESEGPVTNLVCGFFEFRNRAAWPLLDSLAPVIILDLSDMSEAPQVRTLVDLMVGELTAEAPGYHTAVNQLAYLLFIQVIRQQIRMGHVNSGLLAALFDPKISRALCAIHNHAEQHWSLDTLAREATMGRSAFAQRFQELAHTTPMSYLTAWRMQQATSLLRDTRLSVLEISERSGYGSEAAFRKAYRKNTGRTPGAVRREGKFQTTVGTDLLS